VIVGEVSTRDPVELLGEATELYAGGQLGRALTVVDEALRQASAQQHRILPSAMIQKAGWLREAGQTAPAAALLAAAEQELQRSDQGGASFEWSGLRTEQAALSQLGGDYIEAESLLAAAEALAREGPAAELQLPDVYANQAKLYLSLARLREAQQVLFKALEIDRRVGNDTSIVNDLNMLGTLYGRLGDVETARAYLEESLALASTKGLAKQAADAMSNLAAIADDRGEHAEAADMFATLNRFYVDMREGSDVACSVANEGIATVRSGDYARGRKLLSRAHELHLELGNAEHAIYDLVNLSSLESEEGNAEQALSLAVTGLASARDQGLIDLEWKLEFIVAQHRVALVKAGPSSAGVREAIAEALEGLVRAADIIELLRTRIGRPEEREWFVVDKEGVYESAIALCAALGRTKDLLRFCERARARAFLDAMGMATVEQLEKDDPRRTRRAELVSKLMDRAVTPEQKPQLLHELRLLRAQSAAERPLVAAITDTELPGFDEVCAAIPPEACLLEYFQTDNAVFYLLMDRTGLRSAGATRSEEPLETLVTRLRQEVIGGDSELATAHSLFVCLIRPVMAELSETKRLIIVPHRSLHYVPWSTLWFKPAGDDAPERQYLRNRFFLATMPSASYIAQQQLTPSPDPVVDVSMVLGDPVGDLAGAEAEAREVANRLDVSPLLGSAATRAAFLEAAPSAILHLAAHGSYNPDDPLLSALHMADGVVTVEDMLARAPRTKLLVLSGCVTGLSERRPGDELIGLARAALLAGARSILVTLWETSDEASRSFFQHFYRALLDGSTVSEAVAWAQHQLATGAEGYDHPVDWAPFVLLGDPDYRPIPASRTTGAAFDRAVHLAEQGDVDGARAAFERMAEDGDPELAAMAFYNLGNLLDQQKDVDGARRAYVRAADSGDSKAAHLAAYNLGILLANNGDAAGALVAFERTVSSGDPELRRLASRAMAALRRHTAADSKRPRQWWRRH
jgi:CHAT domain-containing protein/TolA-binding protein